MVSLTMGIESYLKMTVDIKLYDSLDENGSDKFFEKCTIELMLKHSPKKNYGLSKGEFTDLIIDVFNKLYCSRLTYDLEYTKLYCYENPINQYRLVIARTKKEALELACSFSYGDLRNALGSKKSMRKVDVLKVNPASVVLDNGEERPIESLWFQTVNLYDSAIEMSEGGAQ
jgi:hypothetical protein